MSIKQKLTAIIMLASAVILFLGITVFVVWGQIDARQHLVSDLHGHAGVISDNCKAALAFSDEKDAEETISAVKAEDSIVFACIYDKQGRIFARYQRVVTPDKIQPPRPRREGHCFKNGHLSVFRQIELDGEIVGIVHLLDDMSEIHSRLVRDTTVAVGTLLSVLVIAFFMSSKLQKVVSAPILNLAKVAENISEKKDYSVRVTKHSNDEIGHLVGAFNKMLNQIQKRDSELVEARDHLETRVSERTEELTLANKKLAEEITERKQIEKELSEHRDHLEELVTIRTASLEKTNEKLARSNTDLQEFVYIASHDLREPLRKISSFGELVKGSLSEGLEEDDKENLDYMIDGAERMTEMIEALLVYSRVNTNDITLSTVDLNKIIEQFSQLELATLLEETKATIEVPQLLPTVKADKVLVRQLIQNLIVNGIKYQKPDTAPRIEITARQIDNDNVRIEIKDNGIGIEKEMHQTIFKMFKRVHSREEYQGTGIGLAVCKKIAEKHGSQIGVDSEQGKGSVFWFTMSLEKELAAVS